MVYTPRLPMWRNTPPALFPPLLGLFGLGLAWRRGGDVYGLTSAPGDLILGAVSLVYVFVLVSYGAKLIHRPGALRDDFRVLPGRAGLPAASMSAMLCAAALVPIAPGLAEALLWAGLALHVLLALGIAVTFLVGPAEQRRVSPAWHLAFVGLIVSPAAAVPLGLTGLAQAVTLGTMAAAAGIYGASLVQWARGVPPAPLRPLLAIHLAPVSLFGTACALLEWSGAALVFAAIAGLGLLGLVAGARWLTQAGFSPLWGALTFPLAAFTGLMLLVSEESPVFALAGGAGLIVSTIGIPWIALRIFRMWPPGALAAKTNAAVA